MSNVRFRLSILSSTTSTDRLDFSVEKALTVTKPFGALSRLDVLHTAATIVYGTTSPDIMLYVKNLDPTNFIEVSNDAGEIVSKVVPNMFVLIGVPASAGIKFQADTATCEVEYGFWSIP
jgi:hypothetical protein